MFVAFKPSILNALKAFYPILRRFIKGRSWDAFERFQKLKELLKAKLKSNLTAGKGKELETS